jgi:multicomponent Na+:H+ antiporter subunit E
MMGRAPRLALVFLVCFLFWLSLSGHVEALGLILGVVASALVAWLNRDLEAISGALGVAPRFCLSYLPWLLKEIVVATLDVARIIVRRDLPIDPVVVRIPASLRSDLARTTFGNSITLTPGTVTLDVDGSDFVVHALTRRGAAGLADGAMARRVARTFGEPPA